MCFVCVCAVRNENWAKRDTSSLHVTSIVLRSIKFAFSMHVCQQKHKNHLNCFTVEEIPPFYDKLRSLNAKMVLDFGQIVKIAVKFTLASHLSPS